MLYTINLTLDGVPLPQQEQFGFGRVLIYEPEAGIYEYEITTDSGESCSGEFELELEEELQCEILGSPSCFNGMPIYTVGFGQWSCFNNPAEYIFEWSNGYVGDSFSTMEEGEYLVTITDINSGCQGFDAVTIDFSEINQIEGYIWEDSPLLVDNVFDVNSDIELGIPGFTVFAYSANDLINPIDSTFTDNEGFYSFRELDSDEAVVGINLPQGFEFVEKQGGSTELEQNWDSEVDPNTGVTEPFS